jgi:light-harvesting complex I chlorophyll a/b binding protein 4
MAHYREAELKNGRVAMAACLGWYITSAGVHPAFNSALSSDPLQAARELPLVGWLQFVLGCGAIEWMAEQIKKRPGYVAGDIFGASYWVDDSDEGWVDYQNKELSNGRLAMVAIMGIIGKLCIWMPILHWVVLLSVLIIYYLDTASPRPPVWKLR